MNLYYEDYCRYLEMGRVADLEIKIQWFIQYTPLCTPNDHKKCTHISDFVKVFNLQYQCILTLQQKIAKLEFSPVIV